MTVAVYRIQDSRGRGPFQPGLPKFWADENFAPGMKVLPTWMEEFGFDLIDRLGKPREHFGSAVTDRESLSKWFSDKEWDRLQTMGFWAVSMRADRILAQSENQVLFARRKPFYRDVIRFRRAPFPVEHSHEWFVPSFMETDCCRKCGVVRRADDTNKPCVGVVHVGLRETQAKHSAAQNPTSPSPTGED